MWGWKRERAYGNGNGKWTLPEGGPRHFRDDWDGTPRFSTDIEAAWKIVEHIRRQPCLDGDLYAFTLLLQNGCYAAFHHPLNAGQDDEDFPEHHGARAETPPLAICRAALLWATGRPGSPE